jgi:GTP cyclohydrolase I
MCSHHLVPIIGKAWIAVIPGEKLFGLSKFSRVCDWIMSRPQIQEEATVQLADFIEEKLNPMGTAIVIKATHMCMNWRGVKDTAEMTTSTLRGVFAKNDSARKEFLSLIK